MLIGGTGEEQTKHKEDDPGLVSFHIAKRTVLTLEKNEQMKPTKNCDNIIE